MEDCSSYDAETDPAAGDDSELRRDFPQYVRALAEVYGVLSEAASDINNISV